MSSRALRTGQPITWSRNRGRNGNDVPSDVPIDMSCESVNVELVKDSLGRRRLGSNIQDFTGDTYNVAVVLARFSPAQNDAAAELHFVTAEAGANKIIRVAGGTVGANLTLKDNVETALTSNAVVLNGKLYWAYDSAVNRLHVYDPALSTTTVRRAGLKTSNAATVANTGAGSYPATLRYYQVRWAVLVSSTLQRESEASAMVSFTPSGGGTAARVTQPTDEPDEGETHWRVEASADGINFFDISGWIVVATTTYDDSALTSTYASNDAVPLIGARTPFPSCRFLCAGDDRLFGFGVFETAAGDSVLPRPGRVYISPVLDSSDQDDDERLNNTVSGSGYVDVGRNRGYEDRAIVGPVDGQYFVFQSKGAHMLVPTGEVSLPYRRITLSPSLGAVSHWSTFVGEDESGKPCVYWLDPVMGPYRYGRNGLQWCGYDVKDIWDTFNPSATNRAACGHWDPVARCAVWFIACDASNNPSKCIVFYAREGQATEVEGVRYGWTEFQSTAWFSDAIYSTLMFPTTFGATMSRKESPYIASARSDGAIVRMNVAGATTDNGTGYHAYVRSPVFELPPKHVSRQLGNASYLQASAHAGANISQTITGNFGDVTGVTKATSLAPTGSQTRVLVKFDDVMLTDIFAFQVAIGDASAIDAPCWTLDEWSVTTEMGDER